MKNGKLTLDLDRLEVVSHPMQDAERGTPAAQDEACPTASAT